MFQRISSTRSWKTKGSPIELRYRPCNRNTVCSPGRARLSAVPKSRRLPATTGRGCGKTYSGAAWFERVRLTAAPYIGNKRFTARLEAVPFPRRDPDQQRARPERDEGSAPFENRIA